MKIGALASIALAVLVSAGTTARATEAADSGPPIGYTPDPTTDEAGLWMQADKAERDVQTSPLLVRDPALNDYVRSIVCKLASTRCAGFRIYIVEIPMANAYAMPNGAIVVWTGLLLRMQNEAQLAFVLGHEMTHYFRRHSLERFESIRDTMNTVAFTELAGLFALPIELVAGGALVSYTRDQEREADAGGFDLATAAGYDPAQAAAVWKLMAAEDKADPNRPGGGIFGRDHPSSDERLATLAARGNEIESSRKDWVVDATPYRSEMISYRTQWLADEIARGNAWESVVLLESMTADEPNSGILDYYLGEAYRRRGTDGDSARALTAYAKAIACPDAPAVTWRDRGLLAMKDGDKTEARTDFASYLAKAPSADDREMIRYYVQQLGEN